MIGALVLGGDFQALGVVRSLARNGVEVCIADSGLSICRYSKYVRKWYALPEWHDARRFAEGLIELATQRGLNGWVLFPNDDLTVKLIAQNHKSLSRWYRLTVPRWPVARQYYYKDLTAQVARGLGIPVPRTYTREELATGLVGEGVYPLVLKPVCKEGYFDITRKKAVLVGSPGEFVQEYDRMSRIVDPRRITVQEFIPGGTQNLYSYGCVFDGEEVLGGLAARRLRQHPVDFGRATTYAVSTELPILEKYSATLLRAMGFWGMAEVEFMWDERSKQFKLLEVNGRPWGWHTLARGVGLELPYMLFRLAAGLPVPRTVPKGRARWIRFLTDSVVCVSEVLKGKLGVAECLRSYKGPRQSAVFSADDPWPFFVEVLLAPYFLLKKGF